jgi:hypothetical protein
MPCWLPSAGILFRVVDWMADLFWTEHTAETRLVYSPAVSVLESLYELLQVLHLPFLTARHSFNSFVIIWSPGRRINTILTYFYLQGCAVHLASPQLLSVDSPRQPTCGHSLFWLWLALPSLVCTACSLFHKATLTPPSAVQVRGVLRRQASQPPAWSQQALSSRRLVFLSHYQSCDSRAYWYWYSHSADSEHLDASYPKHQHASHSLGYWCLAAYHPKHPNAIYSLRHWHFSACNPHWYRYLQHCPLLPDGRR